MDSTYKTWQKISDLPKSPFLIFDLEEALPVNIAELEKRYRLLVRQFHPDLADGSIDRETIIAISSKVNNAYKLLKNQKEIMLYLMEERLGERLSATNAKLEPNFLALMMEFQAEVFETEDQKTLEELNLKTKAEVKNRHNLIAKLLEEEDVKAKKADIMKLFAEANYYERLNKNICGRQDG